MVWFTVTGETFSDKMTFWNNLVIFYEQMKLPRRYSSLFITNLVRYSTFLKKDYVFFIDMLDFRGRMLDFKNICSTFGNICSIIKIYARLSGTYARLQIYMLNFSDICSVNKTYARLFRYMLNRNHIPNSNIYKKQN